MCHVIDVMIAAQLAQRRPDVYPSAQDALSDIKNYFNPASEAGFQFKTPVEGSLDPDALFKRVNEARAFYGAPEAGATIPKAPPRTASPSPSPRPRPDARPRHVSSSPILGR